MLVDTTGTPDMACAQLLARCIRRHANRISNSPNRYPARYLTRPQARKRRPRSGSLIVGNKAANVHLS